MFIVLVLIVPAVAALGSHPVNSSASHEARTAARVTSSPEALPQTPSVAPSVAYTLDLCTNILYSGNALPIDCSWAYPWGVAYDSGKGEAFVSNYRSLSVSVISDATNKVVDTIPVGTNPAGVAYDSGKGEVFVTNEGSNNVSVISDATNKVVDTIPVGSYPVGVAFDSGTGELFVTNSHSNNLSVISDATNKAVATIRVGTNPDGVAYDNGKGEVFVTNDGSRNVSVISDATNKVVATTPVGTNPVGVAYDSGKGEVFVTNDGSNNVSVISDATNKVVATIPVGTNPDGVAYDRGKGEVFVTNGDNVSVVSDTTNAVVATIPVGSYPDSVAYDSGKGEVFVTNYASDNVSVVSDATNKVVATIPVGTNPVSVGYDSGKGELFVANWGSNNVSVISDATNKVVATIPVGTNPVGVVYDSGKGELFVANWGSNNVNVISDTSNTVVAAIPVGTNPEDLVYDSGKGEVFVTNDGSTNVSVISDTSNTVVATIPVGPSPSGVAYDSGKGELFEANWGSANVSVISDATNKVVANIPVGTNPDGVAYDSGKGEIFVANEASTNVSVISDASNTVTSTVTVGGEPLFAVYDLATGYVYVSNFYQGTISIITTGPPSSTYPISFSESGLPSGTNWSVTLNSQMLYSTASTITFSEPNGTYSFSVGTVPGYTANVTSGSLTVNGNSVSRSIAFTPQTPLTSVSVSPSTDTLKVGTYANFTATPTCTGGPCSGVSYTWSLNNTALGNLNTTSGASVEFTATASGTENLSVTAMLNGKLAKNSSSITITTAPVPTLAYVSLTPLAATVNVSGSLSFAAAVGCSGGTCPSGSTYTWSLNNSLGKLNISSGPQVLFTANSTAGLVNLTVTAHLNGKTATNSSIITIRKSSPPPSTYAVTFSESGLPSGTSWSVSLNGTAKSSTTTTMIFQEANGSYVFTVGSVSGYTANPSSSSVKVNGAAASQSITFTPSTSATYAVTFSQSGLPSGTTWSVTLNGSMKSGTGSIVFTEPNGTYSFNVGVVSGYTASPISGSFTVSGVAVSKAITFTALPPGQYSLVFSETGLPSGTNWSVAVGTTTHTSTGSTISFTEANGTYSYTVGAVTGFTATPSSGSVTVNGAAKTVSIAFAKASTGTTYSVIFTETGLPTGTSWSVTLNGSTKSSTTSMIAFQETNGSYSFSIPQVRCFVGSCAGGTTFVASPSSGTVKVTGAAVSQSISFTSSTSNGKTNQTTGVLGLPGYDGYILVGVVVAAAAAGVVILLLRKRSPPRGYGVQDSKNIADGAAEQVAVE